MSAPSASTSTRASMERKRLCALVTVACRPAGLKSSWPRSYRVDRELGRRAPRPQAPGHGAGAGRGRSAPGFWGCAAGGLPDHRCLIAVRTRWATCSRSCLSPPMVSGTGCLTMSIVMAQFTASPLSAVRCSAFKVPGATYGRRSCRSRNRLPAGSTPGPAGSDPVRASKNFGCESHGHIRLRRRPCSYKAIGCAPPSTGRSTAMATKKAAAGAGKVAKAGKKASKGASHKVAKTTKKAAKKMVAQAPSPEKERSTAVGRRRHLRRGCDRHRRLAGVGPGGRRAHPRHRHAGRQHRQQPAGRPSWAGPADGPPPAREDHALRSRAHPRAGRARPGRRRPRPVPAHRVPRRVHLRPGAHRHHARDAGVRAVLDRRRITGLDGHRP